MKNKASWYRQRKAILYPYEREILTQYPKTPKGNGIYVLTRKKDNQNVAYIGQSIHVLQRIAEHMVDYKEHIDRSLKIYGLKTILNPQGWKLESIECNRDKLDIVETNYVADYIKKGYKVYNKTSGGQGEGKRKIAEYKEPKGYRKGVEYGYLKARKEIAKLFEKNLVAVFQGKSNKLKERALWKFQEFINVEKE